MARRLHCLGGADRHRDARGQAMMAMVLGVAMVMFIVPVAFVLMADTQSKVVQGGKASQLALEAAEAAVTNVMNHIQANPGYAGPEAGSGYCSSVFSADTTGGTGNGCTSSADPNDPGFVNNFDSTSCPDDTSFSTWATISGSASDTSSGYQFELDSRLVPVSTGSPSNLAYVYAVGRYGTSGSFTCRTVKAALSVDQQTGQVTETAGPTWGTPATPAPSPDPSNVVFTIIGASGGSGSCTQFCGWPLVGSHNPGAGGIGIEITGSITIPGETSVVYSAPSTQGANGETGLGYTSPGTGFTDGGYGGHAGGGGGGSMAMCIYPSSDAGFSSANCTPSLPNCTAGSSTAAPSNMGTTGCVLAVAAGGGGGGESNGAHAGYGGDAWTSGETTSSMPGSGGSGGGTDPLSCVFSCWGAGGGGAGGASSYGSAGTPGGWSYLVGSGSGTSPNACTTKALTTPPNAQGCQNGFDGNGGQGIWDGGGVDSGGGGGGVAPDAQSLSGHSGLLTGGGGGAGGASISTDGGGGGGAGASFFANWTGADVEVAQPTQSNGENVGSPIVTPETPSDPVTWSTDPGSDGCGTTTYTTTVPYAATAMQVNYLEGGGAGSEGASIAVTFNVAGWSGDTISAAIGCGSGSAVGSSVDSGFAWGGLGAMNGGAASAICLGATCGFGVTQVTLTSSGGVLVIAGGGGGDGGCPTATAGVGGAAGVGTGSATGAVAGSAGTAAQTDPTSSCNVAGQKYGRGVGGAGGAKSAWSPTTGDVVATVVYGANGNAPTETNPNNGGGGGGGYKGGSGGEYGEDGGGGGGGGSSYISPTIDGQTPNGITWGLNTGGANGDGAISADWVEGAQPIVTNTCQPTITTLPASQFSGGTGDVELSIAGAPGADGYQGGQGGEPSQVSFFVGGGLPAGSSLEIVQGCSGWYGLGGAGLADGTSSGGTTDCSGDNPPYACAETSVSGIGGGGGGGASGVCFVPSGSTNTSCHVSGDPSVYGSYSELGGAIVQGNGTPECTGTPLTNTTPTCLVAIAGGGGGGGAEFVLGDGTEVCAPDSQGGSIDGGSGIDYWEPVSGTNFYRGAGEDEGGAFQGSGSGGYSPAGQMTDDTWVDENSYAPTPNSVDPTDSITTVAGGGAGGGEGDGEPGLGTFSATGNAPFDDCGGGAGSSLAFASVGQVIPTSIGTADISAGGGAYSLTNVDSSLLQVLPGQQYWSSPTSAPSW